MPKRTLSALVIATSSGATMRSERPKPIHLLCGRPMISYVLDALESVETDSTVVVTGLHGDWVSKRILEDPPAHRLDFVEQRLNRGSADAALVGLTGFDDFDDEGDVIIVPADLPLLETDTLATLLWEHRKSDAACTVLTAKAEDPAGHDRVIRDGRDRIASIIRHADLVGDEHETNEVSLGVFCIRRGLLAPAARRTRPDISDGLQHIASIVEVLAQSGHPIAAASIDTPIDHLRPVDNRRHLAEAEAELRRRTNLRWLDRGVTMIDPERTYIDVTVELGTDVTLFPGTILQGTTVIGDGCEIGPDSRIDRCQVGRNTVVEKTMARLAEIGDHCRVGPFAVVEPGAELADGTVTGPFYAARPGE